MVFIPVPKRITRHWNSAKTYCVISVLLKGKSNIKNMSVFPGVCLKSLKHLCSRQEEGVS